MIKDTVIYVCLKCDIVVRSEIKCPYCGSKLVKENLILSKVFDASNAIPVQYGK